MDLDRTVIGSAVPTSAALKLETDDELKAEYFLERRELGVMNVGGVGSVVVDGKTFELDKLDVLYVGRGSKDVSFASKDAKAPANFYLLRLSGPCGASDGDGEVRGCEAGGTGVAGDLQQAEDL